MVTRKKTPWGVFVLLLIFMEILVYYICGIFKIPGISLENYQEYLLYVFTHPFQNWMNPRSTGFMGVAFLFWVMFIGYYLDQYRNFQFGREKGSEDWGDVKTLSKTLRDPEGYNTYLSKNIAVSNTLLSNMNLLVIGGSGSYKTTSVVVPNLLQSLSMNISNVYLDIKGDLLRKYGNYLKAHGIAVKSLNLINPEESDRYNPFAYLEKETDVIRLITNLQQSVKPPDAMKGDPFWDDGVALYLQSMFFHEWLSAKEAKRKATMNNILRLVNMETKHVMGDDGETVYTELQLEMNRLAEIHGEDYPPVRDYRKLKEGASETVRSIIIMVNAMLRLCETAAIKRILEDDDIDIPSLGLGVDGNPKKKTALFLVMPDNDQSFNFLISMFYTQLFDILLRTADFKCHGELPIHVRLWADEFYAGPKPNNPEALMGTIRSRNVSMVPVLQSISQAKALFPNDKWEIFIENCASMIYLGSGPAAYSTHEYISKLLGEMTIDTRNDSNSRGHFANSSLNNAKDGRTLMTPAEVKRMSRKHCIIFLEGQYPIYDHKAIPFKTKPFEEAKKLEGKDGYKNPVNVVYNEQTMTYKTIIPHRDIQFLSKEDLAFYKEAEKTDPSIKVFEMNEEDFLYLNWNRNPRPTEEEIIELMQQVKEEIGLPDTQTAEADATQQPAKAEPRAEKKWDLSGSVFDCIKRYADQLTPEQLEEIISGLEAGLTEKQVKTYFMLPAKKMSQYKRAFMFCQK